MAQNFIGLKGNIQAQTQIPQLQQQIAEAFVNNQLQNAQTPQNNNRATVEDLINSTLTKQIDIPRFTTIQDIVNAPKGEKLKTFGQYVENNPDVTRLIGSFLGGTRLDTTRNRFIHSGEEQARRQEAQMQAAQERALDEMKAQSTLAKDMYNAYQQKDIADMNDKRARDLAEQQEKWARERFAQELALKQLQLNSQISHQRAIEGIARERLNATGRGSLTGGAAKTSNMTPKQIQKNQEMLNSLNAVQSQMDRFANSFGKVRGSKPGALLADAYARSGFGNQAEANFNAQRTLLFNKIARELGGEKGVLSDQDIKRIEGSLPSLSDSLPQKRAKMQAVYDLLEDRKSQFNIGGNISSNNDPLGLGL